MKRQRIFHADYWMHNRWPKQTRKFEWLIDHFWPVPTWPEDWRDPKYEAAYLERIDKEPGWKSKQFFSVSASRTPQGTLSPSL
jgi:hypothetical protein